MPDVASILLHGALWGAILSVLLGALFLVGAYLDPEVMLRGYPPDIKAKYGPGSARSERNRRIAAALMLLILAGTSAANAAGLAARAGGDLAFLPAWLGISVMLMVFNAVDLLILDLLVFVAIQPRFVVLPGTEGLAGYRDRGFHVRAFLKGCVLMPLFGAVAAGVTALAL
jgi:hypothetical protein